MLWGQLLASDRACGGMRAPRHRDPEPACGSDRGGETLWSGRGRSCVGRGEKLRCPLHTCGMASPRAEARSGRVLHSHHRLSQGAAMVAPRPRSPMCTMKNDASPPPSLAHSRVLPPDRVTIPDLIQMLGISRSTFQRKFRPTNDPELRVYWIRRLDIKSREIASRGATVDLLHCSREAADTLRLELHAIARRDSLAK